MTQLTSEQTASLDDNDQLSEFRTRFHIPEHNGKPSIYLCGNSLGLQPVKAREYVDQEMRDWAELGVEGHFHAKHPWMPYHEYLTGQMAEIVGAKPEEVVVMNSLTVNLHLLMVSFYRPHGKKRKVLVEHDIFPSDLYAVRSQVEFHGGDPDAEVLFWKPKGDAHIPDYADLEALISDNAGELALIMLGGVNYYTGQSLDLKRITEVAHDLDITVGFDLAHGAGNIPYRLHDAGPDFAAWCSYKYLNSGPGSLSGVFIHERHIGRTDIPRFAGWWGHNKETRFGMRDPFDPIPTAEGWQLSNPPILPMAAMRASLELFQEAGMDRLREKSIKLTNYLEQLLHEADIPGLEIITPSHHDDRGCQLSLLFDDNGRKVFNYISNHGVIADWREPDVIRVAPVPLYNSFQDVSDFVGILQEASEQYLKAEHS